ncbi:MAG: hypothetical protein LUD51_03385, partial [Clostridia bacterium]|nr:hypothetical protein [Clostridia bacterium]
SMISCMSLRIALPASFTCCLRFCNNEILSIKAPEGKIRSCCLTYMKKCEDGKNFFSLEYTKSPLENQPDLTTFSLNGAKLPTSALFLLKALSRHTGAFTLAHTGRGRDFLRELKEGQTCLGLSFSYTSSPQKPAR